MHQLHERRRQHALRQVAPAIDVARLTQVYAGEIQQVEAIEHRALRAGAAVLHGAERRLAALVESDDLPVEHHSVDRLPPELGDQPGKITAELESAPRAQPDAAAV